MGLVSEIIQLGFTPIQAIHLGVDGRESVRGGWIPPAKPNTTNNEFQTETWTFASSTTVTVPSGAASRYQLGDRVKFDNSTTKYFFITGIADTTLTLNGGSDYTVANSAISNIFVSRLTRPYGFPKSFTFALNPSPRDGADAVSGSYGTITTNFAKFFLEPGRAFIWLSFTGTQSTASCVYMRIDLPISTSNLGASLDLPLSVADDGVKSDGYMRLLNNLANARLYKDNTFGTNQLTTGTLAFEGECFYEWG